MKFEQPLVKAKFIKRYKRFFTEAITDNGETLIAHTPNTGSMKTCLEAGWDVMLSEHNDFTGKSKRKLKYTLEMSHNGECWIGLHTGRANGLVKESIESEEIPELLGYQDIRSEMKFGDSRIDLFLSNHQKNFPDCFIEIKNVTLKGPANKNDTLCLFPDAVSLRGQKHLKELIKIKQQGMRAIIFFVVQRTDCELFSPTHSIDPIYARLLNEAHQNNVEILVYQYEVNELGITLKKSLPYKLEPF